MSAGSVFIWTVVPKFGNLLVSLSRRRLEDGGSKGIVNVGNIDNMYKEA
jgi:hypothetical protein